MILFLVSRNYVDRLIVLEETITYFLFELHRDHLSVLCIGGDDTEYGCGYASGHPGFGTIPVGAWETCNAVWDWSSLGSPRSRLLASVWFGLAWLGTL